MKDRQIFHPMNPSNLLLRVNNIHHSYRPTQNYNEIKFYSLIEILRLGMSNIYI